jgi:hypothetical protein
MIPDGIDKVKRMLIHLDLRNTNNNDPQKKNGRIHIFPKN